MSARVIPGWPWWQRLNLIFFTFAGGCAGFHLQHRYQQSHKEHLRDLALPALERDLAAAVVQREKLEHQLLTLTNASHPLLPSPSSP